jgi:hypothetical protein
MPTQHASSPFDALDPNLRLAILQALADQGLVTLPHVSGDPDDEDDDSAYEPDPALRDALLAQCPIPEDAARALTTLSWSAGRAIQFAICEQWDGGDDFFDLHTLDGIGHLSALTELRLDMYVCDAADLTPLASLKQLTTLTLIGVNSKINSLRSLAPLLELPALQRVELDMGAPDSVEVCAALRARGVEVIAR